MAQLRVTPDAKTGSRRRTVRWLISRGNFAYLSRLFERAVCWANVMCWLMWWPSVDQGLLG